MPRRHLNVVGNAFNTFDAVRKLTKRGGDVDLAFLLKGAHAPSIGFRGAADQNHWPAVLLGVRQACQTMHYTRPCHNDASTRAASHIAVGLCSIGCGLLVAHAYIVDAFFLCRSGNRAYRKADDAKQMVDALLFQTSCYQGCTCDLAHLIHLPSFFI